MNTVAISVFSFLVMILISTISMGMEIDCNNKAFMCSGEKQFYPCVKIGENKTVIVLEARYCPEGFVCNDDADNGCQEPEPQANLSGVKDLNSEITSSPSEDKNSEFDTKANELELANNLGDLRENSHVSHSNAVQRSETTVSNYITDSFTHDTTATEAISATTPIYSEFTNDPSTYTSINNDKANLISKDETELTTDVHFEEYITESNTKADQELGEPYTSMTYSNYSLEIGSNAYVTPLIPSSNGSSDISNGYSTESINSDSAGYNIHHATEIFESHTDSSSEQKFSTIKLNDNSSEVAEGINKIGNIFATGKNSSDIYFTSMLGYDNSSKNDGKVSNIQSLEDRNIEIVEKNKTENSASYALNQIKAEDVSTNDKYYINISVAEEPYNREENATTSAIPVNSTTNGNDLQDDLFATNGAVIEDMHLPTETVKETINVENNNYSIDSVAKSHEFEIGSTKPNEISTNSAKSENRESSGQIYDEHNFTIISATSFGEAIKDDIFDTTANIVVDTTESITSADNSGIKYNSREISAFEENEMAVSKETSHVMTNEMSVSSTSGDKGTIVVTNNNPTNFPKQLASNGSDTTNIEFPTPLINPNERNQDAGNEVSSSITSKINVVANTESIVIPNEDSTTPSIIKLIIENQNNFKPIFSTDAITTKTSLLEMESTHAIQNSTSNENPGKIQEIDVDSEFGKANERSISTNEIINTNRSTEETSDVPVEVSIESINGIVPSTNSSIETISTGFVHNYDPKTEVSTINHLPSTEGSSYEKKESHSSVVIGKEVSTAEETMVSNFHESNTVKNAGQFSHITGTTIITSVSDLLNIGREKDNLTYNDANIIGLNTQLSWSNESSYNSVLNGDTATTIIVNSMANTPQESTVSTSIEATNILNDQKLDSVIANEITEGSIDEKEKSDSLTLIRGSTEESSFAYELNTVGDLGRSTYEAAGKTIMSSSSNLLDIEKDHNKFMYGTEDSVNLSAQTSLLNESIYKSTIDASSATEVATNSTTNSPKEGAGTANNEATIAWYNQELDVSVASNSTERSVDEKREDNSSFAITSDTIQENSNPNNMYQFNIAENVGQNIYRTTNSPIILPLSILPSRKDEENKIPNSTEDIISLNSQLSKSKEHSLESTVNVGPTVGIDNKINVLKGATTTSNRVPNLSVEQNLNNSIVNGTAEASLDEEGKSNSPLVISNNAISVEKDSNNNNLNVSSTVEGLDESIHEITDSGTSPFVSVSIKNEENKFVTSSDHINSNSELLLSKEFTTIYTNTESVGVVVGITNLFENDTTITSNKVSIALDEEQYDGPVVSETTETSAIDQKMEANSSFLIEERSNDSDPYELTVKNLGEKTSETITSEATPSPLHLLGAENEETKFFSDTEDNSQLSSSKEHFVQATIAAAIATTPVTNCTGALEEDVITTSNEVLNALYRQEHDNPVRSNTTGSSEVDNIHEATSSTIILSTSDADSMKVVEHDTATDSQLSSPEEPIFESLANANTASAGNTTSVFEDDAANTSTGVPVVWKNEEPDGVSRIAGNQDFDQERKSNSSLIAEESGSDIDLYETSTIRNLSENMYETTNSANMPSLSDIIGIKMERNKFDNGTEDTIPTNSQLSATFETLVNTNTTSAGSTINTFEEDAVTISNGVSIVLDDQKRDNVSGVTTENSEGTKKNKNSVAIEERNSNSHLHELSTVRNLSENMNETTSSTIVPSLSDILNIKNEENKLGISTEGDSSTNSQLSSSNGPHIEPKIEANATIIEMVSTINIFQEHGTNGVQSTVHNHEINNLTLNKTEVSSVDEKREMARDTIVIENSSSSSNDLYGFNTLDNISQTTGTTTTSISNLLSTEELKQSITDSIEVSSNSPLLPPEEFSVEPSTNANATIAVVMGSIMNMFEEDATIINDMIPTVLDEHTVDGQIVSKTTQSSVDNKGKTDSLSVIIEEIHSKDKSSVTSDVDGVNIVENFDEGIFETSNNGISSLLPTITSILNTVEGETTIMHASTFDNSIVITEAVHNNEIINGNTVEGSIENDGNELIYTLPHVYSSTIEETELSTVEAVVVNNNLSINSKPYDELLIEGGNLNNIFWEISPVSNRTVDTSAEKDGGNIKDNSNKVYEVTTTERGLNNANLVTENKLDITTQRPLTAIESERTPGISYEYIRETSKPYDELAFTNSVSSGIYANLNIIDNVSDILDITGKDNGIKSAPAETSTGETETFKTESVTKKQEQLDLALSSSKPININSIIAPKLSTSTKISSQTIKTTTVPDNGLSGNILNLTPITQKVETTTVQIPPSPIYSLHTSESDEEFVCEMNGRFPERKNTSIYHTCIHIGINSKFLHFSTVCPHGTLYDSNTQNCIDNPVNSPGSTALVCNSSGIFSHPTNCNRYYKCFWRPINKKYALWLFKCPPHMGYDSKNTKCVSAALLPHCGNVSETLADGTESPFFCTENGRFPMEYNCEGYYDCKEKKGAFQVKVKTCSEGKLFDRELGRCRKSDLVFCPYEYDNVGEGNSKESQAN